jgi:hypothetical protein
MLIGGCMQRDFVLDITAQGAWNGGTRVDNSIYENRGMQFKGGIPVTRATIEERIGVRTRMSAPEGVRIGVTAFKDLLSTSGIDPSRIRVLIAATNLGEDKYDPGPSSRTLHDLVRAACPQALVFDLYAGCPGFNVSVETLFHLSLAGELGPGDISVVVGAENPHRGQVFKPLDTANIIFGDDALAPGSTSIATAISRPRSRKRSCPGRWTVGGTASSSTTRSAASSSGSRPRPRGSSTPSWNGSARRRRPPAPSGTSAAPMRSTRGPGRASPSTS